jgi:hypothetical protein
LATLHTSLLLPFCHLVQCLQFLLGLLSTGTASCDMCTGLLTWSQETKLFTVFSKMENIFPLVLRHPNSVPSVLLCYDNLSYHICLAHIEFWAQNVSACPALFCFCHRHSIGFKMHIGHGCELLSVLYIHPYSLFSYSFSCATDKCMGMMQHNDMAFASFLATTVTEYGLFCSWKC